MIVVFSIAGAAVDNHLALIVGFATADELRAICKRLWQADQGHAECIKAVEAIDNAHAEWYGVGLFVWSNGEPIFD